MAVGLDWFRVTSLLKVYADVLARLEQLFGPALPGRGMHFYDASWRFANGAALLYDVDGSKGHCIDLPGNALKAMPPEEAVELCRSLLVGRRCTRIDPRVDWRAEQGVGLIDACVESCRAGELCRARVWKPQEERTNRNLLTGYGVCFGRRGKNGSGRYVRVYDKGLETGEGPPGTWERWEAELTGDVAAEAAERILAAEDWVAEAVGVALGCVEFRDDNGSTALDRRPLAGWWSALLEGVRPIAVVAERVQSSLQRYAGWLHFTVAPTLAAMGEATGQTIERVVQELGAFTNVRPCRDGDRRPAVWQFVQEMRLTPRSYSGTIRA